MKKQIILPLLFVAVGVLSRLPHPAADVGRLDPVSLVRITWTEYGMRLETDTGAVGEGADLAAAGKNLHSSTGAEVFLETADYVLLPPEGDIPVEALLAVFRPSCRICLAEGEMDLEEASSYLPVHKPTQTLYGLRAGLTEWEKLTMEEGRGELAELGD